MKHLTITYGDLTLFDGDVEELTWTDSATGVSVSARTKSPTAGAGLLGLLNAARRTTTPTAEETA